MNPWALLELEPGVDRAQIKRAYAAKLKVTRPDVDPEGFKKLHAAYKLALRGPWPTHAPQPTTPQEIEPNREEIPDCSGVSIEDNGFEEAASVATDELSDVTLEQIVDHTEYQLRPPPIDNLAQLEQELVDKIDQVMGDPKRIATADAWRFLEDCEELNDIQLRAEFSFYLFGRLLEEADEVDADSPGFAYLNEFFSWTESMDLLGGAYGYEAVDLWLASLDARQAPRPARWILPKNHPGPIEWAGYYRRIGATLIDLAGICAVLYLYGKLAPLFGSDVQMDAVLMLLLAAPTYLACTVLFEASPVQGTPGKVLLGMKVTTPKGRRANVLHILWRTLVFATVTAAIKITVWINFFLHDGRLLHDRLSGTIVIRRI